MKHILNVLEQWAIVLFIIAILVRVIFGWRGRYKAALKNRNEFHAYLQAKNSASATAVSHGSTVVINSPGTGAIAPAPPSVPVPYINALPVDEELEGGEYDALPTGEVDGRNPSVQYERDTDKVPRHFRQDTRNTA